MLVALAAVRVFNLCQKLDVRLNRTGIPLNDLYGPRGDDRDLVIDQGDDFVGFSVQWRRVARNELLALADADHQRATAAGCKQEIWLAVEHDYQAIGSTKTSKDAAERIGMVDR